MPVRIREAEAKDAEPIASIHVRAWQEAYRGQLDDGYLDGLTPQDRLPTTRTMIESPPDDLRVWVAEEEGSPVGFAVTGVSQDADADRRTGELYAVYLEPDRVGTGVGRTLCDHAIADLRSRGFTTATLWVLETNERARAFYEKAGWGADGTVTHERVDCEMRPTIRYRVAL
jgi:ribosomal protein S18 acetylase RimI-like enzyme